MSEQIDQEIDEFRVFEREGVDPQTGARFDDALRLVTVFLERNVPDDDEMLVGYEGDRAAQPHAQPVRRELPRGPAVPGRGRVAARRRRHARGRRRDVRQGLGLRRSRAERGRRRGAGDHQLPRRRARRAREHAADVRRGRGALARPDHAARRPAVRTTAGPAADGARDRERHHDQRPLAADPRDRERRHHGADPDVQRHARPARGRRASRSDGSSTTPGTSCGHR